ncbi:MAG: polysaccharide deacetylase family protein [Anaerolineales bacterium]|nr:polysaccharide deacetylase family protein [Anaerolineales bacterium]
MRHRLRRCWARWRNGAQADFFMDANAIAATPTLVDAIFAAWHGVAPAAPIGAAQSGPARDAYFQGVGAARTALAGRNTACLQLPYGAADAFTRAYAAELGYEVLLWDIDARDWAQPGAEAIASAITSQAFPGAVVRLNDLGDPTQTAAALDQALPALAQQGYSVRAYCVPVMSIN